ncbi:AMP-binding protein [Erwinia sp. P7711]|uniref:AMP-binding protein n=1 Tax=Erwinia sp. P7711 TaxID=3141451 RepID=UPI00318A1C7C
MSTLPVAQWLSNPDGGPVARLGAQLFSRQQWQQEVTALGHRLLAHPARRWALCFEDSYLFSVALLATLHAGKVPVIPGHCRESLLQEQSSEFDAVLTDGWFTLNSPILQLPLSANAEAFCYSALPVVSPDAFVVLFTSGSTGAPRQVIKPVRCLDAEARCLAEYWGDRLAGCTVIATVSHQHLYGLTFRLILPLALGLPFDCGQILYSEQLSALAASEDYLLISSPAFLRRLDRTLPAPRCKLIVSAGGELPWSSAQEVNSWLKQPVEEIYGSTETGVLAVRSRTTEKQLWQPFDGVTFSQDARQRWWARSPLIPEPQGWQLDDKLAFTRTGFQLGGRYDRTVKVEDKRVSLSEIERRLLALPQVTDAAALAIRRPERSGIGVVLVLDADYDEKTLAQMKREWRQELCRWLEPVALPRYWRIVSSIPHNSQSKRAWPQIEELFYAAR